MTSFALSSSASDHFLGFLELKVRCRTIVERRIGGDKRRVATALKDGMFW